MRREAAKACAALCLCALAPGFARAQAEHDETELGDHAEREDRRRGPLVSELPALPPDWEDEPAAVRPARGTHLLLELSLGLAPSAEPGPAGTLVFGAGGRPKGTSLRLYGIAELSALEQGSGLPLHALSVEREQRSYLGAAAGVRVYVPLYDRLRLHTDVLLGASYNTATLVTAASRLEQAELFVQAALGLGLAYRAWDACSLGVRAKWLLSSDPLRELRDALALSNAFPVALMLGATWHL